MQPPSAIIFVNDSITTSTLGQLTTKDTPNPSTITGLDVQLQITETMTFAEFNARVAVDPNYPTIVHLNGLRILVILPDFHDLTNRNLADIVIFVKQGLASIEKNNFGPPKLTLPVQRLNIYNLINGTKGSNTACFPFPGFLPPPQTQTPENPRPHERLRREFPEGMGALELFGTEAFEENGMDEGAFGGKIVDEEDASGGGEGES